MLTCEKDPSTGTGEAISLTNVANIFNVRERKVEHGNLDEA